MNGITDRQREVMKAIADYDKANNFAPSIRNIQEITGHANVKSIQDFLTALARKGLVEKAAGCPRSLHLTKAGKDALKGDK